MHTLPASTLRHGFALPFAGVISIALLFLMAQLIHQEFEIVTKKQRLLPPIIMPAPKPPLAIVKPPTKPEPVEKIPDTVLPEQTSGPGPALAHGDFKFITPVTSDAGTLILGDGEPVPYLRSQPIYPSRALTLGIEGYVDLEFSITRSGATADIVVIRAEPEGTFNRAAKRALAKWKYKPRMVDGNAVRSEGLQTRLRFQIQ
jgi:protein TonB